VNEESEACAERQTLTVILAIGLIAIVWVRVRGAVRVPA
jgi:hypothetical protein